MRFQIIKELKTEIKKFEKEHKVFFNKINDNESSILNGGIIINGKEKTLDFYTNHHGALTFITILRNKDMIKLLPRNDIELDDTVKFQDEIFTVKEIYYNDQIDYEYLIDFYSNSKNSFYAKIKNDKYEKIVNLNDLILLNKNASEIKPKFIIEQQVKTNNAFNGSGIVGGFRKVKGFLKEEIEYQIIFSKDKIRYIKESEIN